MAQRAGMQRGISGDLLPQIGRGADDQPGLTVRRSGDARLRGGGDLRIRRASARAARAAAIPLRHAPAGGGAEHQQRQRALRLGAPARLQSSLERYPPISMPMVISRSFGRVQAMPLPPSCRGHALNRMARRWLRAQRKISCVRPVAPPDPRRASCARADLATETCRPVRRHRGRPRRLVKPRDARGGGGGAGYYG